MITWTTLQYHTGCRMAWTPSSSPPLRKLWNQSWTLFWEWFWLGHTQRCYNPSTSAQHFLVCSSWPFWLPTPLQLVFSWLSRALLSVCGYVSCSSTYHFASGYAYRISHLLAHMKTSLVVFITAAERERKWTLPLAPSSLEKIWML